MNKIFYTFVTHIFDRKSRIVKLKNFSSWNPIKKTRPNRVKHRTIPRSILSLLSLPTEIRSRKSSSIRAIRNDEETGRRKEKRGREKEKKKNKKQAAGRWKRGTQRLECGLTRWTQENSANQDIECRWNFGEEYTGCPRHACNDWKSKRTGKVKD